jgi:hypothetical protein
MNLTQWRLASDINRTGRYAMNAAQSLSSPVVNAAGIGAAKTDLLERGWYISYMNYYATGEGVTTCVAVGGSPESAEDVLRERINAYFHGGVKTEAIDRKMSEGASEALTKIPDTVIDTLRRIPPGAGYYFSELHFNLA